MFIGGTAAACAVLATGSEYWHFLVGLVMLNGWWNGVAAVMYGQIAVLDRTGRYSVLSQASVNMGTSIGPGLMGLVLQSTGNDFEVGLTFAGAGLAVPLVLFIIAVRLDEANGGRSGGGAYNAISLDATEP